MPAWKKPAIYTVALGPAFVTTITLAYRYLAVPSAANESSPLGKLVEMLFAESPVLCGLLVLAALRASIPFRSLAWGIPIVEWGITSMVMADSAAMALINRHFCFSEAAWVVPALPAAIATVPRSYAVALLLPFVAVKIRARVSAYHLWCAVILWCAVSLFSSSWQELTGAAAHNSFRSYLSAVGRETAFSVLHPYTAAISPAYAKLRIEKNIIPRIPPSLPSILLVINESLSSVDSLRLSGINDYYPRMDKVAARGMLYENTFSNAYNSVDGMMSILVGVPPVSNLRGVAVHEYVRDFPSRTRSFRARGYRAELVATTALRFGGFEANLYAMGFHSVETEDTVPRFQASPKFVWDAAPDHVLYEELLERVAKLDRSKRRFLLVAKTISGHIPFKHPRGGPNDEPGIRDYIDRSLEELVNEFERRGFGDDTILIITGDHRKQVPPSRAEFDRYGSGAMTRIPLMVFGAGVTPGVASQPVQQTDILADIGALTSGTLRTNSPIVFVERRSCLEFGSQNRQIAHGVFLDATTHGMTGTPFVLNGPTVELLDRSSIEAEAAISYLTLLRSAATSE